MKILVVYYSRTGATKKVAEMISEKLACDSEELIDLVNRKGIFGWIRAGFHAARKRPTELRPLAHDVSKYELVIVGTPVWAGNTTPAARTFIRQNRDRIKKVAFFCTMGGKSPGKTMQSLEEEAGKPPQNVLSLSEKVVMNQDIRIQIDDFVRGLMRK